MPEDQELAAMQQAYRTALDHWVEAIRAEEALVMALSSVAEVDKWEAAHFHEDEMRNKAKAAKKGYEDALRKKLYQFLERHAATRVSWPSTPGVAVLSVTCRHRMTLR